MPNVYLFNEAKEDRYDQGNKGANLITMTKLGLPVPPGFIVSIAAWREYRKTGKFPEVEIREALTKLEKLMGRKLGKRGLTVSVRSSGPVSMPGMMDTVLNVADWDTILRSVKTVFDSWNSDRANTYRKIHGLANDLGTAAVIQAMVMGNADDKSGTGVLFTRNSNTGEKGLWGEYLPVAQGEDVVSGARTPMVLAELKTRMPKVYAELETLCEKLEHHYREMQDIEFTVESGVLYMLQTRTGKRSGAAAVKIAVDLAKEGRITQKEAVMRVTAEELRVMLHKRIASPEKYKEIVRGLAAAPGAATGVVVFELDEAVKLAREQGVSVVLVRPETKPDDILGISVSQAILTSSGGLSSHAAIVTRAMGKPCICGAEDVKIDMASGVFRVGSLVVKKGDVLTIDGTSGKVYQGSLPLIDAEVTDEMGELLGWADRYRKLGVRANADTASFIKQAIEFGAEGVGLCRTERQFQMPESLAAIRRFILAETDKERKDALVSMGRLQKKEFVEIFHAMGGRPVIIRLLDVPLHEFLPNESETTDAKTIQRIRELHEINPMMGHRGVRVGITYPELYEMQIDAIAEAKAQVSGANPAIMIPQVIEPQEVLFVRKLLKERSIKLGIMVETVRACIVANDLAGVSDFFSFGTNDLTQATLSFSREDAEKKFLTDYLEKNILPDNPFETLDQPGVGRVASLAVQWGREKKPNLEIGVCGEHGGDPRSIRFFHTIGVTYVSCSPFRVPIARLVAAQAALDDEAKKEKKAVAAP
ncbi:MAG: pyruvate, phosphate dikinase [Chloroflexota bacterium]|nr:pyruvate, phosphate dikinase [Chloroflexota bacterium]